MTRNKKISFHSNEKLYIAYRVPFNSIFLGFVTLISFEVYMASYTFDAVNLRLEIQFLNLQNQGWS